jgi:DNA polymerase III epsilon subunit-like protein
MTFRVSKPKARRRTAGFTLVEAMVATAIGYHNDNPHRAEADVRMSAAILFELIKRLQTDNPSMKTAQDLLNYQGVLSER